MKYEKFRQAFSKAPFFRSHVLMHIGTSVPLLRRQISEWLQKGYLVQLKRGMYTLRDSDREAPFSRFFLANELYTPSYISLESALSFYNMLPEAVHAITSVSSKKTQTFQNSYGLFLYRHLKPSLYAHYVIQKDEYGYDYRIAIPEKALLDFLYLKLREIKNMDETIFDEAFRLQNLEQLNKRVLKKITQKYNNKKLTKIISLLLKKLGGKND